MISKYGTGYMSQVMAFQQGAFRSSGQTRPRVLRHHGQPVDIANGLVCFCKITAYNYATGLYSITKETVSRTLAWLDTPNKDTAYDRMLLSAEVEKNSPRFEVNDVVSVVQGGGINIILDQEAPGYSRPPFYTSDVSTALGARITVEGGSLHFIASHTLPLVVSGLGLQTVASGDKVWIQRDSADTFSITSGASLPTDKIYIELVSNIVVATHDSGPLTGIDCITSMTYTWNGGDIIVPEVFPVTVTGTDGTVGTPPVYTSALTEADIELVGEVSSSINGHDALLAYKAGTLGQVMIKGDGTLNLFVFDELPITKAWPQSGAC